MEKNGAINFHVKNTEKEKSTRKKMRTALSEVFWPKLSPFSQTNVLKRKGITTIKPLRIHKQIPELKKQNRRMAQS